MSPSPKLSDGGGYAPWTARCHRYTAPGNPRWQSWFMAVPGHVDDDLDWVCDEFWGNDGYPSGREAPQWSSLDLS
jgi:hypothetical protein